MPAEDVDFFRVFLLIAAESVIERCVGKYFLAAPPSLSLPEPRQLGKVGVKLCQKPSTLTLLNTHTMRRGYFTSKKRGKAPEVT